MFSELIDDVVSITGRFDRITQITGWANAVINECDTGNENGPVYFKRDWVEDQVALTGVDPLIWQYPQYFRKMDTVQYPNGSYPAIFNPGKVINPDNDIPLDQYIYFGPTYAVFVGVNNMPVLIPPLGTNVNISYYTFLPRLKYKNANTATVNYRPAVWDDETGWTYFTVNGINYGSTPALQAQAQTLVSNWVLQLYREMVLEGVLAKTWNSINNIERARVAYATYRNMRNTMMTNEQFLSLTFGTAYGG